MTSSNTTCYNLIYLSSNIVWSGLNLFSSYKLNYKAFGLVENVDSKARRKAWHFWWNSIFLAVVDSFQISSNTFSGAAPLLSLPLFCPPDECISCMDDRQTDTLIFLSVSFSLCLWGLKLWHLPPRHTLCSNSIKNGWMSPKYFITCLEIRGKLPKRRRY